MEQQCDVGAAFIALRRTDLKAIYDAHGDEGIKLLSPMNWMAMCTTNVLELADQIGMICDGFPLDLGLNM